VGNLLDNAFKFTRRNTEVSLNAYAAGDRIFIDVTDNCGGLAAGEAEKMFVPSTQRGVDEMDRGLSMSTQRPSKQWDFERSRRTRFRMYLHNCPAAAHSARIV